jgi:hypothetical protein
MQSVDERGHGPDRKAVQKRMRDVDVASVDFGVKKASEAGRLRCGPCGQRASAVTGSRSALSGPGAGSVCLACVQRGWHGERSDVSAAGARPNQI